MERPLTPTDWPSFSLLFFASQPAEGQAGKFDLFRASTRFADEHGFEAVWIPERHFHASAACSTIPPSPPSSWPRPPNMSASGPGAS